MTYPLAESWFFMYVILNRLLRNWYIINKHRCHIGFRSWQIRNHWMFAVDILNIVGSCVLFPWLWDDRSSYGVVPKYSCWPNCLIGRNATLLVNEEFLIWVLIDSWLCCQPTRNQIWKCLLTNMDFNIETSLYSRPLSMLLLYDTQLHRGLLNH